MSDPVTTGVVEGAEGGSGALPAATAGETATDKAPKTESPPAGGSGLNAELLEKSFALLAPHAEEVVSRFYFRLFRAAPETYYMFPQEHFGEQKRKLLAALKLTVNNVRSPDKLVPVLEELGARHLAYGAAPAHYPVVGAILLATLGEFAGPHWTPEVEKAWTDAYGVIQDVMLRGAARRRDLAAA